VGPVKKIATRIKQLEGHSNSEVYECTIVWKWEDDDGRVHSFNIPNSLLVSSSDQCLLSPQHLAQELRRQSKSNKPGGTGFYGDEKTLTLFWGNKKFKRTLNFDQGSANVAWMYTAAGYKDFESFCARTNCDEAESSFSMDDRCYECFNGAVVSDDEGELSDTEIRQRQPLL
jgi:hypothetical protein